MNDLQQYAIPGTEFEGDGRAYRAAAAMELKYPGFSGRPISSLIGVTEWMLLEQAAMNCGGNEYSVNGVLVYRRRPYYSYGLNS